MAAQYVCGGDKKIGAIFATSNVMHDTQPRDTQTEYSPRVLIVDDEVWIRAYLEELMTEWGYVVSTADKVARARALLEERDIDLVITDLFIREEVGLTVMEIAQRVRSSPEVIVITGRGDAGHAVEALGLGAFDFLTKPLDGERLRLTIRRALELRRLKAEVARLSGSSLHPFSANVDASSLAFYDSVTGLPNRVLFFDRLQQTLLGNTDVNRTIALVVVSLQGLRRTVLVHGWQHFDDVLSSVAKRLPDVVFRRDIVSRTGENELTLVAGLKESGNVVKLLEKITQCVEETDVAGRRVNNIYCSIGVSFFPSDGETPEDLYQKALIALDLQQQRGQAGYQFYKSERSEQIERMVKLEHRLERGLDEGRFSILLQPYHRVADGAVHGAEALLRWDGGDGTYVPPTDFVPLLESSRLIIPVTEWIVAELAALQARFLDGGIGDQWLSLNMSPVHLQRYEDIQRFVSLITGSFRRPSQLIIEVTEGIFLENTRRTDRAIALFSEAGIPLAIDDFGTGYSSLSYLTRYGFDYIKIDRAFVGCADVRADASTIVAAIISMAQQLGIASVAEGVENEAQLNMIRRHGCDIVQGYHFSRPLSPQALFDYAVRTRAGQDDVGELISVPSDENANNGVKT